MPEFIAQHVPEGLSDFVQGYLEAAEWLLDEEIDPSKIEGFSDEAIEQARKVCAEFQIHNAGLFQQFYEITKKPESAGGHDLWLTRNRHGAGFWDRGAGPAGDTLTEAAHALGETDCYLGDDGYLYFSRA